MPLKTTPPQLPGFEDEATLFSLSSEFLEAATVLAATPPVQIGYSLVTYYLTGHAAELMLKSFLFKRGDSIEALKKKYQHNLKQLVSRARTRGLPLSILTEHIQSFSRAYSQKCTEYRKTEFLALPPLDLLIQEVRRLQSYTFNQVAELN